MRIGLALCVALLLPFPSAAEEPTGDPKKEERSFRQHGKDGVTNPRVIPKTQKIPDSPRGFRGNGRVILQARIEADGSVSKVSVIHCNFKGKGLEEVAVEAVKKWKYEPATKDGKPIAVNFTVVIQFTSFK